MTAAPDRVGAASREAMAQWTSEVHDAVTAMFERLDGSRFEEASWQRKGGGGGQARLLAEGKVFEKAGVNRALVEGILPPEAAARLGGNVPAGVTPHFFITSAARAFFSTIEAAVCFCAGLSGIGVVLAQMSLAPVFSRRATISSSRFT